MKVGVFESFRTYVGGALWRFDDHWERWQQSAILCGVVIPAHKAEILERLSQMPGDKRVRLWTDGILWRLEVLDLPILPDRVVLNDIVHHRENPQAKHDGHDYHQFYSVDFFDTIWFDEQSNLLEGNISNVFAMIDGQLCTSSDTGILPGLMRQWVIDHFEVVVRPISRTELKAAEAIFLTNMVRGVVAVDAWGDWSPDNASMVVDIKDKLRQSQPQ